MPRIYLSPSTQENNLYVSGGTEEYYMNLVADNMIPWLLANGIRYTRNTPDMTAASSIRQSKESTYDFYLALHSNAAPEGRYGTVRGSEVYYSPKSRNGRRAADIFVRNLKQIYPLPDRVRAIPTTTLGEVVKTIPPAVLVEFAYHDNPEDAAWIVENISALARVSVRSLTDYFGLPFAEPIAARRGTVMTAWGNLNLRAKPSTSAVILGRLPKGSEVVIYGQWEGWYTVHAGGKVGYVSARYIQPGDLLANG